MTKQTWWELYKAALTEVNTAELRKKIDLASLAMHERTVELASKNGEAADERRQLVEALHTLRTLQRLECSEAASAVVPPLTLNEEAQ